MGTLRQLFKFDGTVCILAVGLLLLGGCTTPLVNVVVQVDTCQAGGMRTPLNPAGLCNGVTYTGAIPSGTICKNINGQVITCPANATCSSGAKCADTPGTCTQTRTACKTIWTESSPGSSSGSCICGCS
jgi:hypothetical protein